MKRILFVIVIIAVALLICPVSSVTLHQIGTSNETDFIDSYVKNSSGAIYVVYTDYLKAGFVDYVCRLAYSTDEGITWNTTETVCDPYWPPFMKLMIDANDKISVIYSAATDGNLFYINYSLADGWGSRKNLTDVNVTDMLIPGAAIDSSGTIHTLYAEADGSVMPPAWSYYKYQNVSSAGEIGDETILRTNSNVSLFSRPLILVDQSDTVHMIWGEDEAPYLDTGSILYQNFSSSGLGDVIVMTNTNNHWLQSDAIMDSSGTIHMMLTHTIAGGTGVYYANTSAAKGFKITDSILIDADGTGSWPSIAMDTRGTLHFLWNMHGGTGGIYYRNLSSSGLGSIETFNTSLSGTLVTMYSLTPPGNIPNTTLGFINTEDGVGYNPQYGSYQIYSTTPIPPTSPWTDATTSSDYIQNTIFMGIIVIIVASVATIILIIIKRF